MFTSLRRRGACEGAGCSRPQYGAAANLPALSICRLEAPEEILKKLRKHAEDPAMAEFTCPICWEPFWQPVRTVCGHAFCEGCLLKSVLAQLGYDQPDVSCPMCRHPLHVEDVAADEGLLTRIRVAVAQKSRESEPHSRAHGGRLHRGSTRSPIVENAATSPRALRCTGQPCTPMPAEWPTRACNSGSPGSWMRPPPDSRPATSGCVATSHSVFWPQTLDARPSTSGAWARSDTGHFSLEGSVAPEEEAVLAPWPTWPVPQRPCPRRELEGCGEQGLHFPAAKSSRLSAPLAQKTRPRSQPASKQGSRTSRLRPDRGPEESYAVLMPRAPGSSRGPRRKQLACRVARLEDRDLGPLPIHIVARRTLGHAQVAGPATVNAAPRRQAGRGREAE